MKKPVKFVFRELLLLSFFLAVTVHATAQVAGAPYGMIAINCSTAPAQPSTITGDTEVCPATAGFIYSVTNVSNVSYNWTAPAGWTITAGQGANSITVTSGTAGGNISVTPMNACGSGTARTLAVTVAAAFAQPNPAAQTVCYNTAATLTLAAATGGLGTVTYQWQNSTNNSTWANISGATAASYTTPALTANMYYRRQATAVSCGGTITSSSALVTVVANFTQPNPTAQTICYNTAATLTLAAATGGSGAITYQWQNSTNNSTWANISGATAASYTTTALTANTYYRRLATTATCGTITSTSALVTVTANFTQSNPTAQSVCNNTAATLTLAAATGGSGAITYQWQSSTNNSTWTNISGATAASYTTPALTTSTYYRRLATAATCGGTITSASALITITPLIATPAMTLSNNCIYNSGQTITASIPAVSGATSYAWTIPSGLSATTATTGTSVTFSGVTAGTYTVKVTVTGTCNSVTVTSATITVKQVPNTLANAKAWAQANQPDATHGLWVAVRNVSTGAMVYYVHTSTCGFSLANGVNMNGLTCYSGVPVYSYNGKLISWSIGTTYTSMHPQTSCTPSISQAYWNNNIAYISVNCDQAAYVSSGTW